MLHDPELRRVQAAGAPGVAHSDRRLVHRFVGQLERSPVRGNQSESLADLLRVQVVHRLHAILGVHVNGAHKPAWVVSSDGHYSEVERSGPRRNFSEGGMQRRVAAEQNRVPPGTDGPATPQSPVTPAQRSAGKVLRRHAGKVNRTGVGILPPVPLDDVACTSLSKESADTERGEPAYRGIPRSDAGDRTGVEMIVVVV